MLELEKCKGYQGDRGLANSVILARDVANGRHLN